METLSILPPNGILTLIFIFMLMILYTYWKKTTFSMPGPTGLPLVGYVPYLTDRPYIKFQKLAKVYGPVYKLRLGNEDVVILNDFQSIKEAYEKDAFFGYPPNPTFKLSQKTLETGAMSDLPWKEQKKLSLQMLKGLGLGKTRMEEQIKTEALHLLQYIEERCNTPLMVGDFLTSSMASIICSFLFGKGLEGPKRVTVCELLQKVSKYSSSLSWEVFFPWIRKLSVFLKLGAYWKFWEALEEENIYVRQEIEEHVKTLDRNNIRDFVDGYLLEIEKRNNHPDSPFNIIVLEDLARTFLGAGTSNSSNTIHWMLIVTAVFPEVQERILKEIEQVIGYDRFPTPEDELKMPYTEAAMMEGWRWKPPIPLNVMRYTLQDTNVGGYFVPKHTQVLANFWAVLQDEKLWGTDVNNYRPERFLSEDGMKVVRPEFLIPFSVGKRACPGRKLVHVQEFMFLTAVLQKFKLSIPSSNRRELEDSFSFGLLPKQQYICFTPRSILVSSQ